MASVALLPTLAVLLAVLLAVPGCRATSCYKCSDLLSVKTDSDDSAANFFGGILNSISDAVGLPPCSEFNRHDDRFQTGSCPLGGSCLKTVIAGKTVRSCAPSVQQEGCKESDKGVICTCTSDYCNAAGRTAPALLLLLLPAALLTLLTSRL